MTKHSLDRPKSIYRRLPPAALVQEVATQSARAVGPGGDALIEALQARFGASLAGVLFYGSCLHSEDLTDGLVDLYALVDSYGSAYPGWGLRLGNALLGPNVFYLEASTHDPPLKAKYAVMSVDHFERGCSRWFHSYLWARFAQPARLAYWRGTPDRERIERALSTAVMRFLAEATQASDSDTLDAAELWSSGLRLAYASELRTERNREGVLTDINRAQFETLTTHAAPALSPQLLPMGDGLYTTGTDSAHRMRARFRWRVRRWQGRVLSILRLAKAAFTFDRGADYLAWKIERHTGVTIVVTPTLRNHPILFGPKFLWSLLRKGTIR
jgi:hypothetical protein